MRAPNREATIPKSPTPHPSSRTRFLWTTSRWVCRYWLIARLAPHVLRPVVPASIVVRASSKVVVTSSRVDGCCQMYVMKEGGGGPLRWVMDALNSRLLVQYVWEESIKRTR